MAAAASPVTPVSAHEPMHLPAATQPSTSRLNVVRKPSLRVRQAVRDNNVPLLQRLQYRIDLRNTDRMRLTSLAWAALECNTEVFEWLLLDYGHDDQELSRDAEHNTIFHLLAAAPAPIDISPASHILSSSPDFPPRPTPTKSQDELYDAALRMTEVYYTLFPFLIDWSNTSGKTALHFAAQADNPGFIAALCDFGADVDLADLQGNTPLHYASAWGNVECARVLLERGATVGLRNFEGFTSSDFAYTNGMRAALDAIAREVLENRRARRKEERVREKEERAREKEEMRERERMMIEQQQGTMWDDGSSAASAADAYRNRSGSQSSSASRFSAPSSHSHSHSHSHLHHSHHDGDRERGDAPPPLPPLPPDVLQAAQAATNARHERRERGSASSRAPSRADVDEYAYNPYAPQGQHGSPTPVAARVAHDTAVPTLTLSVSAGASPLPTPSPSPVRPQGARRSNPPTPLRSPVMPAAAAANGSGTYSPTGSGTASPMPGAMGMLRGASSQSVRSQASQGQGGQQHRTHAF